MRPWFRIKKFVFLTTERLTENTKALEQMHASFFAHCVVITKLLVYAKVGRVKNDIYSIFAINVWPIKKTEALFGYMLYCHGI